MLQSGRHGADQNVDRPTVDAVILAEIEEARSFNEVRRQYRFVGERFKQALSLGELRAIADSRENLVAHRANKDGIRSLDRSSKVREQSLLFSI
jgi:hypothetical protein